LARRSLRWNILADEPYSVQVGRAASEARSEAESS